MSLIMLKMSLVMCMGSLFRKPDVLDATHFFLVPYVSTDVHSIKLMFILMFIVSLLHNVPNASVTWFLCP